MNQNPLALAGGEVKTKTGFEKYLEILSEKDGVEVSSGTAEADWSGGRMTLSWDGDMGYPWLAIGDYTVLRDTAVTEFERHLDFNVLSGMKISEL